MKNIYKSIFILVLGLNMAHSKHGLSQKHLSELTVSPNTIALSEHNSTTLSVTAKYADNSTEDVSQKASYSSSDNSVDVDKGVISSNESGTATITISYEDKTTSVEVEVYETIEGHRLPPEPKNPDATLLGVDVNDNGVRDEVERWIYKTEYYTHSQINRVVAMQEAKFYQMTLVDPNDKDNKVDDALMRVIDCKRYYEKSRNIPLGKGGRPLSFNLLFQDKYFNTRERLKTYMNYNYGLGEIKVYTLTSDDLINLNNCDENIDLLL